VVWLLALLVLNTRDPVEDPSAQETEQPEQLPAPESP